jgi:hypothetical protein
MIAHRTPKVGSVALATLLAAITLSGCTDARRALGYDKSPPDEFAVVSRAPLAQPPDFNLRPPAPGAPRPQEGTSSDQARAALTPGKTGVMNASLSKGEQALMIKSGADKAPPDIRRKVDEESSAIVEADNGFTEKLIFWRSAPIPGDPVDAQGEANRLKANASLGKPATAGDTVIIDRKSSGFLSDIF